nr:trypsin-like peptidase domain-containing protein [uncultured Oscillibacter sp.]
MKKRILSLLCVLVLLLAAVPAASALEGEAQRAADTLSELQLLDFVPAADAFKRPASRTYAVQLLARLYGLSKDDLPSGAYDYAVSQGWVTVTRAQGDPIPAAEFCADLLRQLGYEGFTDENADLFARRAALTTRDYGETLTLGDLYQLLRDALTFPDTEGVTPAQRLVDKGLCTQEQIQDLFPEELTARQIADRHMAAVFELDVFYTKKAYKNNRSSNGGSAFFVSADGLAVTNYHTLDGAVVATATLITGETFPVEKVLFFDPSADIALIRVSRTSADGKTVVPFFSCLELEEEPEVRRGDRVYTLSVPLSITPAISEGIVSSTDHMIPKFTLPCIVNTADISHGSSGGALLNAYGHVVGVTSGAYEAGNSLYISIPLTPVLEADWEAEGLTLEEVIKAMKEIKEQKAQG